MYSTPERAGAVACRGMQGVCDATYAVMRREARPGADLGCSSGYSIGDKLLSFSGRGLWRGAGFRADSCCTRVSRFLEKGQRARVTGTLAKACNPIRVVLPIFLFVSLVGDLQNGAARFGFTREKRGWRMRDGPTFQCGGSVEPFIDEAMDSHAFFSSCEIPGKKRRVC